MIVKIYKGTTVSGSPISTATGSVSLGSWSSGPASPELSDGQYVAVATEQSLLGNPEGTSAPATFTINTHAPTVTLASPASPSNNRAPAFEGTASEATPVTVKIYKGATVSGSAISEASGAPSSGVWKTLPASPALPAGKQTFTAVAAEKSSLPGNPEGTSTPVIFTVDTTAPTVTLSQPQSPSNKPAPAFTGTASDTTTVTVKIYPGLATNGKTGSEATATPSLGAWTVPDPRPAPAIRP